LRLVAVINAYGNEVATVVDCLGGYVAGDPAVISGRGQQYAIDTAVDLRFDALSRPAANDRNGLVLRQCHVLAVIYGDASSRDEIREGFI